MLLWFLQRIGVPLEGRVRVQLNLKVEHQPDISAVANFTDIVFPIMWLEEGIEELTPSIRRWVYLATTFTDIAVPLLTYGLILVGLVSLLYIGYKAYSNVILTHEAIELGKRTIRRGSSFIINGQHRLLMTKDSYVLLQTDDPEAEDKQRIVGPKAYVNNDPAFNYNWFAVRSRSTLICCSHKERQKNFLFFSVRVYFCAAKNEHFLLAFLYRILQEVSFV